MEKTRRKTPAKVSASRDAEPAVEVTVNKGARGRRAKKGVEVRVSTSEMERSHYKKPPPVLVDDTQVRTSTANDRGENEQGSRRRPEGRTTREDEGRGEFRRARRRRKNPERGDGENLSASPDRQEGGVSAPPPVNDPEEGRDVPGLKQRNTEGPAVGVGLFMGFVRQIVSFLTPAPPRKRRSAPRVAGKKFSWQAGKPTRLRMSERNIELLKREAEVAVRRNEELEKFLAMKKDDKIQVLHSRQARRTKEEVDTINKAMRRKRGVGEGEREVAEEKGRKKDGGDEIHVSNTSSKKSETEVGDRNQGSKLHCLEQKCRSSSCRPKKRDVSNEGLQREESKGGDCVVVERVGKLSSNSAAGEQKVQIRYLVSKRSPHVSSRMMDERPLRGEDEDVDREIVPGGGTDQKRKRQNRDKVKSSATQFKVVTDPERKKSQPREGESKQRMKPTLCPSTKKKLTCPVDECKRKTSKKRDVSNDVVKSAPSPTKGLIETDENVDGKRHKSKKRNVTDDVVKSAPSPTRGLKETDEKVYGKRHRSKKRDASNDIIYSTPSPTNGLKATSKNVEGRRHRSNKRDDPDDVVKSTPSPNKGLKESDKNVEGKRKRSKKHDAPDELVKSTPSPTKGLKETDKNVDGKRHKSKKRDDPDNVVKSAPLPTKGLNETDKNVDGKRHRSKKRENPDDVVKTAPTPTKGLNETENNVEGKRQKSKKRDAVDNKVQPTTSPGKGVGEIDPSVNKNHYKSKGREVPERKAKCNPAKWLEKVELISGLNKRKRSKPCGSHEQTTKSAPAPLKVKIIVDEGVDETIPKPGVEPKSAESRKRPRTVGPTVLVEVVASHSNRDAGEDRKKRSKSSGESCGNQSTCPVKGASSKLSQQRQKREQTKETMLASSTDEESNKLYKRPQKPRWLHSKERKGEDPKCVVKPPSQTENKAVVDERKSAKSKGFAQVGEVFVRKMSKTCGKVENVGKESCNREKEEERTVKKEEGEKEGQTEKESCSCRDSKQSTRLPAEIREEAKRLGVSLTPKVEKFIAGLKESLVLSKLGQVSSCLKQDKKPSSRTLNVRTSCKSVAPGGSCVRDVPPTIVVQVCPKNVASRSGGSLKKERRKRYADGETSPQMVNSPLTRKVSKTPDIKEPMTASVPSDDKGDEDGEKQSVNREQGVRSDYLDGLGGEILNTLMNDRRLLYNLDALCDAIRTGHPYVGIARSADRKPANKRVEAVSGKDDNERNVEEATGDERSGQAYPTTDVECEICCIDVTPFERKFARYLDEAYLKRSAARERKGRDCGGGGGANATTDEPDSNKDECSLRSRCDGKGCSTKHRGDVSSNCQHPTKKLSTTSIADCHKETRSRCKPRELKHRQLYNDMSEHSGDWVLKLTQPTPDDDETERCKSRMSGDKPCRHSKDAESCPSTNRTLSCFDPVVSEVFKEHRSRNSDSGGEPFGHEIEEDEEDEEEEGEVEGKGHERAIRKRSTSLVMNEITVSRSCSSDTEASTLVRSDIYRRADEIFRRIMVQNRLHGSQHDVLFSSILDKLVQTESVRLAAHEVQRLKYSRKRRGDVVTDTYTVVSVRSSPRRNCKDDERSTASLRQLCYERPSVAARNYKDFYSKLKRKRKGKFRSKRLELSQEDVSILFSDDIERRPRNNKRREIRDEDVLPYQDKEEQSVGQKCDRDVESRGFGATENKKQILKVGKLSVYEVYRETEASSLFKRKDKAKRVGDKDGKEDVSVTPPECPSTPVDDDEGSSVERRALASTKRKRLRQIADSHEVGSAHTLAMVSLRGSPVTKATRHHASSRHHGETSEVDVTQPKRREDSLEEADQKALCRVSNKTEAENRKKHQFIRERPSQRGEANKGTPQRLAVPSKEIEINRIQTRPINPKPNVETRMTTISRPPTTSRKSSCRSRLGKCMYNDLCAVEIEEFPRSTRERSNSKDKRKKTQEDNERRSLLAKLKAMSPRKLAEYLYLNSQLKRDKNAPSARPRSPCPTPTEHTEPELQLKLQSGACRQTPPEKIDEGRESSKKCAKGSERGRSMSPGKLFSRKVTPRIETPKPSPVQVIYRRDNITEPSKTQGYALPSRVNGRATPTKFGSNKPVAGATERRFQSRKPTQIFYPKLNKKGIIPLKTVEPVMNSTDKEVIVVLAPKKADTLPLIVTSRKVSNIYSVDMKGKPSELEQYTARTGLRPVVMAESRAVVAVSTPRQNKVSTVERRMNSAVRKETPRPRWNSCTSKMNGGKSVVVRSSGNNDVKEEAKSKGGEFFRSGPELVKSDERDSPVPQRAIDDASQELQETVITVTSGSEVCTDQLSVEEPGSLRCQHPRLSGGPRGSYPIRAVNETSLPPGGGRVEKAVSTPRQSKRSTTYDHERAASLTRVRPQYIALPAKVLPPKTEKVLPPKTAKVLPPKTAKVLPPKTAKVLPPKTAKVLPPKARSFLGRRPFVSVVRDESKKTNTTKTPRGKFFASRTKITPSPNRNVIDARPLTAKMAGLGLQSLKTGVLDSGRTSCGKPTPCGAKKQVDKSVSRLYNTSERYSSFHIPSTPSPCHPWKKEAEAKQMWWEKHGDKFERKISKTSQDIKGARPRDDDRGVTTDSSRGADQHDATEMPHDEGYSQHPCVEYVTNETQLSEHLDYPGRRMPIEDSRKQKTGNESTISKGKRGSEPVEMKFMLSDRNPNMKRKPQVAKDERERDNVAKGQPVETVDSTLNRYSRSRTWDGTSTDYIQRNIKASSQDKSITERNRSAAKKSVEKWRHHIRPKMVEEQVHYVEMATHPVQERDQRWNVPTPRSNQREHEKPVKTYGRVSTCNTQRSYAAEKTLRMTGAVGRNREDTTRKLEKPCSTRQGPRSESEESRYLPLGTCDLSYGCIPSARRRPRTSAPNEQRCPPARELARLDECSDSSDRERRKRRGRASDEDRGSLSGSAVFEVDCCTDSGNSKTSRRPSENDSRTGSESTGTSNTSEEDSCSGGCSSDGGGSAPSGSCADEQSSMSQVYLHSDLKSDDAVVENTYSCSKYQKEENHRPIKLNDEDMTKSSSHVGVGVLYENPKEIPVSKQTFSCKKGDDEGEVTLITPSIENILARAVGSKKMSRETNTIKQFYKTVQIPHGPSPSSMRIYVPGRYHKTATLLNKGHCPANIPLSRDHVARMPTILSDNNARAMQKDKDAQTGQTSRYVGDQKAIRPERSKPESPRVPVGQRNTKSDCPKQGSPRIPVGQRIARLEGVKQQSPRVPIGQRTTRPESVKQGSPRIANAQRATRPDGQKPESARVTVVQITTKSECPKQGSPRSLLGQKPTKPYGVKQESPRVTVGQRTTKQESPRVPVGQKTTRPDGLKQGSPRVPVGQRTTRPDGLKQGSPRVPVGQRTTRPDGLKQGSPRVPVGQRTARSDCPKQESPRGLNPPQSSPMPSRPPSVTPKRNRTSGGKKAVPTKTEQRVSGRDGGRFQGKREVVYNITKTSNMVASRTLDVESSSRESEDAAIGLFNFLKSKSKRGETIEAGEHKSGKNDQKEISLDGESDVVVSTNKPGEEMHCFCDDGSVVSKSSLTKALGRNARHPELHKRTSANGTPNNNNNKTKQKYERGSRRSDSHNVTVDNLRKFFESSKDAIEQLSLMLSDSEKGENKYERPVDEGREVDRKCGGLSDLSRSSAEEGPNVEVIKAPSNVSDTGSSSCSSGNWSLEGPADKHVELALTYGRGESPSDKNPGGKKVKCSQPEGKSSCSRDREEDTLEMSTEATVSKPCEGAHLFDVGNQTPSDDSDAVDNRLNVVTSSNSDPVQMVYKNSFCKTMAESDEVITANSKKNTHLFNLLTRNLDGNGVGKNYLIINNSPREISVSYDDNGFKLHVKSSDDDERHSSLEFNDCVISNVVLPSECDKTDSSLSQELAQTGEVAGIVSCRKKIITLSSSCQLGSTTRTISSKDDEEPSRESSTVIVAEPDFRESSQGTSRETQVASESRTDCGGPQTKSSVWIKTLDFSCGAPSGENVKRAPAEDAVAAVSKVWTTPDASTSNSSSSNSKPTTSLEVVPDVMSEIRVVMPDSSSAESDSPDGPFVQPEKPTSNSKEIDRKKIPAVVEPDSSSTDEGSLKETTTAKPVSRLIPVMKPVISAKRVDRSKPSEQSSRANVATVNYVRSVPTKIPTESSSEDALGSLSTMSFVDRSRSSSSGDVSKKRITGGGSIAALARKHRKEAKKKSAQKLKKRKSKETESEGILNVLYEKDKKVYEDSKMSFAEVVTFPEVEGDVEVLSGSGSSTRRHRRKGKRGKDKDAMEAAAKRERRQVQASHVKRAQKGEATGSKRDAGATHKILSQVGRWIGKKMDKI